MRIIYLNIKVLKNFIEVYDGSLTDFLYNSHVGGEGFDDLVIFISFDDSNVYFTNKTCNFNLVFNTTISNSGFVDQELIQNQINSGIWSDE